MALCSAVKHGHSESIDVHLLQGLYLVLALLSLRNHPGCQTCLPNSGVLLLQVVATETDAFGYSCD